MNILYWEKYNRVCLITKSTEFSENKKRHKLKYWQQEKSCHTDSKPGFVLNEQYPKCICQP